MAVDQSEIFQLMLPHRGQAPSHINLDLLGWLVFQQVTQGVHLILAE